MTGPDNSALQVFYGSIPLIGAILLTSWKDNKRFEGVNKRIDDLRTSLNKRIDDLNAIIMNGFRDVSERLGRLEDRVTELEKGSRLVRS